MLFPIYSKTRKKDDVTYNMPYPFFHLRHGDGLEGWQVWPFTGHEHKEITTQTNGFGESVINGGHDSRFVLWPFYTQSTNDIGTENPIKQSALIPFYSIYRSKLRDSTSYPWPLGVTHTIDREKRYEEWDAPWPFVEFARGEGKTESRVWPFYSQAHNQSLTDNWYAWPVYKYNRLVSEPLDRERTRILFFLYSSVNEKNTETGKVLPCAGPICFRCSPIGRSLMAASACKSWPFWNRFIPTTRKWNGTTPRFIHSGARRRTRRPARPASRCSGISTGATSRPARKKSRSSLGFCSINPVHRAAAGVYVIFRRIKRQKLRRLRRHLASRALNYMFQNLGEMMLLFMRTLRSLPLLWQQRQKVFDQFFEIGNASLLMVCILSFFIGGVIALLTGPVLVERGLANSVGGLVGIAMCKELAPVMMSILIAGRIGSSMAAEIGSMRVYQELDALRTMNINPIHYLVLPRLVAIAVALPLLVVFSILVGWSGGALVSASNHQINVSFQSFFENLRDVVALSDVANGLFKSFIFALVIAVVSCHQGLQTIGGPRGIGRSVTKAVVNCIVLIVILDYFLTRLML